MRFTLLGRPIDVQHDYTKPPGKDNPGGGLVTKYKYIRKAIPHLKFITDIADIGAINMVDAIWFTTSSEGFYERIEQYQQSVAFKILLISDLGYGRTAGMFREKIMDATDVVVVSSRYTENLVKSYLTPSKVVYIGDPIDPNEFSPTTPKTMSITGCSNVALEKGIDVLIDIFAKLPSTIQKRFIGGTDLWGRNVDYTLEQKLTAVTDVRVKNATSTQVAKVYSDSLAYLADTRYDTYCYAMVEAMASGCWCFLGKHPLYDDGRPCIRFNSAESAVKHITTHLTEDIGYCEAAVDWVNEHYRLDVYRKQMAELIGRQMVYGR